ncbi:Uncharacterised protein [Enterobacter cloacae]|nr:Uncharacterised protein [Enterobacter cloacae]
MIEAHREFIQREQGTCRFRSAKIIITDDHIILIMRYSGAPPKKMIK